MNALQTFIQSKPCGFLTDADVPELVKLDRLCPVLVRCGGCRFTCGAQYLDHMIKAIEAVGDYVRDVSFPVGSAERAASWQPECPVTPVACLPMRFVERTPAEAAARAERLNGRKHVVFNEADCGGVFDGFGVVSDADSGL